MNEKIRTQCDEVAALLTGARQQDYGDPRDSLARIARMWSAYLGRDITPRDVAAMMALLKLARLAHDKGNRDSWRDLAGYAVLGAVVDE